MNTRSERLLARGFAGRRSTTADGRYEEFSIIIGHEGSLAV
jgi:hypothetical protein